LVEILKLVYNFQNIDPNKELVVISFLGKARIGKSTLINCFLSLLNNSNTRLFNTSNSSKEHCTSGIDILKIENNSKIIILLDIQGLDFED
jgi:hypothetical protein